MNYLTTKDGERHLAGYLKKFGGKDTAKGYKSAIVGFFDWHGAGLDTLDADRLREYGRRLAQTDTAGTVKRKFSAVNQFFKYLERREPGFRSPVGDDHGALTTYQSETFHESETFKRQMADWLSGLERDTTRKTYGTAVRLFFEWARKPPGDLGPADFEGYRDHMKDAGRAPSTIWNRFVALHGFLKFLAARSRNFKIPLDFGRLNLEPPRKDAGYDNVLTEREVKALLDAPDRRTLIGKRDHAVLMLMVVYGLRVNEVCKLRFRDVDPERVNGQQRLWIRDRKGRKGKRMDTAIFLNGRLLRAWDDWMENCGIRFAPDSPVFVGFTWDRRTNRLELSQRQIRNRKPLTTKTMENMVERHIEKAGIAAGERVLSPHALRHTALTELSASGIPVADIKYIAAHQDVATTMLYTRHRQTHESNVAMKHRFNR